MGRKLRTRLLHRLESFTSAFGLTLTVDPNLFESPEAGWSYVMDNRLLSRLVRELSHRGHLHSKAYFWVVEFQKRTEFAHWHILLDASWIPFGEVVEIWSRFRPKSALPLPEKITAENYWGKDPAFGSVQYTVGGDKRSAGFYASKYLTKFPEQGFPDWVLDREGRMPRYRGSQGFFPKTSGHDPTCFCEICRGDVEPAKKQRPKKKKTENEKNQSEAREDQASRPRHELPTIRERIAKCGQTVNVVRVPLVELPDGVVVDGRATFLEKLDLPFREACESLGVDPDCWQIELGDGDEVLLFRRIEGRES